MRKVLPLGVEGRHTWVEQPSFRHEGFTNGACWSLLVHPTFQTICRCLNHGFSHEHLHWHGVKTMKGGGYPTMDGFFLCCKTQMDDLGLPPWIGNLHLSAIKKSMNSWRPGRRVAVAAQRSWSWPASWTGWRMMERCCRDSRRRWARLKSFGIKFRMSFFTDNR